MLPPHIPSRHSLPTFSSDPRALVTDHSSNRPKVPKSEREIFWALLLSVLVDQNGQQWKVRNLNGDTLQLQLGANLPPSSIEFILEVLWNAQGISDRTFGIYKKAFVDVKSLAMEKKKDIQKCTTQEAEWSNSFQKLKIWVWFNTELFGLGQVMFRLYILLTVTVKWKWKSPCIWHTWYTEEEN